MTAQSSSFPLSLKERRAKPGFRLRALLAVLAMLPALALGGGAGAATAVKGEVKVVSEDGFTRLAFRLEEEVPATIRMAFPIMVVSFDKPVAVDVNRLSAWAPGVISAARIDPDGKAIRIALSRQVKVNSIPAAERLFVDLLPEDWAGVMPGLPREVIDELATRAREAERQLRKQQRTDKQRTPSSIRVRVASQPTFVRYVFPMPDVTNVVPEQADGKLTLNFDQQIKWDLADVMAALPPTLASVVSEIEYDSTAVIFALNGTPTVRTFREDRSIVVDVGLDGGKKATEAPASDGAPQRAAAAPANGPVIAPPETVPADKPEQAAAQAGAPEKSAAKEKPAAPPPRAPLKINSAMPVPAVQPRMNAAPAAPPESAKAEIPTPPPPAAPLAPKLAATVPPQAAAPDAAPLAAAAPKPASAPEKPAKPAPVAKSKRPPPNPDGPVVVALDRSGDTLRLEFPFAVPTPAAVFRRADILWMVFDSAAKIDLSAFAAESNQMIRDAETERTDDGATVVRFKLVRPRLVSLEAEGPSWIVNIGDTVTVPSRPLVIARSIVGKNRASIAIPFDHPVKIHHLIDSDIGDRLMVVTALAPARGFLRTQDFVELRALPSTQGVVLQPLADDIAAELAVDKITVSRPGGLSLSATAIGQQQLATSFRALTFDTQLWGFDRQAKFSQRQAELIRTAAMAPQSKRRKARLNLARFYLAREMSAEARAVLDVALADEKGDEDVTGSVLKAIADVMLDRPDDALKRLSNPQIGNQLDAPIWRAVAYAQQGKWAEAHGAFKNVEAAMGALPIELQRMALREALRTAIEVRDFGGADRMINEFETIGVPPGMEAAIQVLVGRLDEGLGRREDALKNYRRAAMSPDRPAAAQGRLREIVLSYAIGDMPRKDVIHDLEMLTTVWRGDETEVEGLKLLANLYTQDHRYRDAFHVMRTAMLAHPNSDLTRKIQDEATATFDSLFLDGKGDALPPIEALGLFYDYRELTPIGRRGDEMIRKLADRLVSVDLLDQAAELLQHQVDHRLQGSARAQVATRLAVIYLMNHKSERALTTLRASRTDGLANELRDQRLLLEARALSDTGRPDLALELISNIDSREATRLRSDVLWTSRRWRDAAEQIELLYGERWREFTPLSEQERADILRAAIGYALGDEAIGLARFREKFSAKMADGPDRRAFDIVTAPIGTSGTEFQNVAKIVAGTDTLDAFLRDMRTRYPDTAVLPPPAGGAMKGPASALPPKPADKKASIPGAPEKAAANAPTKPGAKPAAAAVPSKPPTPLQPDTKPTGSIPRGDGAGR